MRGRGWKRGKGMALVVVVLAFVAAACAPATGAREQTSRAANRTTDTQSSRFTTDADKLAFLQRYLVFKSPVEACEFHIMYHDNSSGAPGPSDWDIRVALKVAPADVSRWTADLRPLEASALDTPASNLAWGLSLTPPEPRWAHFSSPALYTRPETHALVAVFAPEGIVLGHYWTE